MSKNTLYITFDGLSDPLGQSQILPYLCGIAGKGYNIHILSCEKKERLQKEKQTILARIEKLPITWNYILYNEEGGVLSRLNYIRAIRALALKHFSQTKISLVHCRSYLASLIGLSLKLKLKIPFIFDMRGFWADERIDGGIWKKSNWVHRFFYHYFKRKEKQFIRDTDAIVSLTNAAVTELSNYYPESMLKAKTTVIPCCTDLELFNKKNIQTLPTLASVSAADHVLIYTGSIGTWYYTREMIDCTLLWKEFIPNIKLLILTKDTPALDKILAAYSSAQRAHVAVASCSHHEVASYLAIAKAAIFFIKPAYSKIASSPTKMAECWAMDLPIITNAGIGDTDLYFNKQSGGILLTDFTDDAYRQACKKYLGLSFKPDAYREIAIRGFDTAMAIEKYSAIYKSLSAEPC